MVVELDRVLATYVAHIGEVLASKVPAITSVGMLLVVTSLYGGRRLGNVPDRAIFSCERKLRRLRKHCVRIVGKRDQPFASISDCGSNGIHSLQNTP